MSKKLLKRGFLAFVLFALASASLFAVASRAGMVKKRALQKSLLVSPAWLARRDADPNIVILHLERERAGYDKGHIPGARFASFSGLLIRDFSQSNVAQAVAALEEMGVSNRSRVVICGEPLPACRAFFILDYLGHGDRTSLLDGGLAAWRAEGRPISTEAPVIAKSSFTARLRPEIVVDAMWIRERLNDPNIALLDARSPEEFAGSTEREGLPRFGHIPGAVNFPWQTTLSKEQAALKMEPSAFKNEASLRELIRAAGDEKKDQIVTYCTIGLRASVLYFVARHLGYEPRMYNGSMNDWSRRAELPIIGPALAPPK
jgi:thiosulfate/3-mercaptopyruvate sulfurtransferase